MADRAFVTVDMVPREWIMSTEQEQEWLAQVAPLLPGAEPQALQRIVAVELPDIGLSWKYQREYIEAAKHRDDLLAPMITSQGQWVGKEDKVLQISNCLLPGTPPTVAFIATAVKK